jgi:hypothetical protein
MFVLRNPELFPGERVAGFEGAVGLAARAVYRYWSSDGLHWQPGDGPLLGWDKRGHLSDKGTSDGCYVYLDDDGTYVMHQKLYVGRLPGSVVPYDCGTHEGTRTIWRRTSIDGVNWSRPQLIMQADWRDPQDTQFMELTRHSLPGGYVGIATTYHTLNQTIDLQFSGSRDGVQWWRPIPRVPCVGLAPLGDLGSGMLWSFGQFVEHAGRLYLYYAGLNGIHGDIYSLTPGLHPFHGALFRVSWLPDRLWAIVPASGGAGSVRTEAQDIEGRTLEVNAYVPEDGELRVELLKDDGTPIAGYTADDCQLISGDVHDAPVRWRGGVQAPVGAKRARFMLQRARLYGFGWS